MVTVVTDTVHFIVCYLVCHRMDKYIVRHSKGASHISFPPPSHAKKKVLSLHLYVIPNDVWSQGPFSTDQFYTWSSSAQLRDSPPFVVRLLGFDISSMSVPAVKEADSILAVVNKYSWH